MKFSKVIGKVDDKLQLQAEEKLSKVFLELGTRYNNEHIGSGMGGDPLIFALLYPVDHICTMNMPTAATDGRRYFWNPKFVIKNSRIGLRIICGHEAWHSIYMHPQRRGSRLPKLWNIAVDYIVNGMVMEDFKARKMNGGEMFQKHLGKYMTLKQYVEMIKDPFTPVKGFEDLKPKVEDPNEEIVKLPKPSEDRELTEKEIKELEKREKSIKYYYADPDLEEDFKSPEKIYDFLYGLLPKCPKCGRIGMYKPPQKKDKNKNKDKNKDKKDKGDQKDQNDQGDQEDQHNHGGDQPCDDNCPGHNCDGDQEDQCCNPGGQCPECGGGVDVFDLGQTLDDHIDTEESEEKLAKRISDAMESAKKMAGYVPGALEDELGKLTAPRVKWQDIVRTRLLKVRLGNGRNDWTRFRSRPMFSGLLVPKRRNYFANFGCLLDTSGSMSKDDMAFGVSQLQGLDDRAEGSITPCDSKAYWEDTVRIKNCKAEELTNRIKVTGRGGTRFFDFINHYEEHIGKCDFLIILTDGYLMESDIVDMKDPGIPVYWVITSATAFKAPFGRVMELRN